MIPREPYGPSRSQLASSHFCERVGSRVHCEHYECPYCEEVEL